MSNTLFIDGTTVIEADWLNAINKLRYSTLKSEKAATELYVDNLIASTSQSLGDLSDTGGTSPVNRRVLVADGNLWQSRLLVEADISDLQSYITVEVNDLTASVTWANVPDVNITQSSVTQHQAALSITESQISDLQPYLLNINGESVGDLSDVNVLTPVNRHVLVYDGVNSWDNRLLVEADISDLGTYEPADATILKDADIGVTVQAYDATILVDADIGVNVQAYNANNALTSDITYETLDTNGDVGTGVGQLAIGNHTHVEADITDLGSYIPTSEKAAANGVATLGPDGLVPNAQIPALAITNTFVAASQAAMLALTAQTGDVCVRTDENKTYILQGTDPSVLGDWQEMLTPTDAVTSVDGRTGVVTLSDLYATFAQGALADTALQAEVNDLTVAVTWANVPDANITQTSVTQHQAALSITESQISDLQSYLTGAGGVDTQIQYNNGGVLSGTTQWTFDDTTNIGQLSGTASLASVGVLEVTNSSTTAASVAIFAKGTNSSGNTNTIQADHASSAGRAIYARATAPTGLTYGVYASNSSDSGIAIYGTALHATGASIGIRGRATGSGGTGGFFENTDGSNTEVALGLPTDIMVGSLDGVEKFKVTDTGAVTGLTFNGVALTTAGSATQFLAGDGNYQTLLESDISDLGTYLENITAESIADLSDVNVTTPAVRHALMYDGVDSWDNRLLVEADISDLGTYLTSEVNDLTAAVTWANVPDANITQSSVTQHEAALSITESQISDLGNYLPLTGGALTGDLEISGTFPQLKHKETDSPATEQYWNQLAEGGIYYFYTGDSVGAPNSPIMAFSRGGTNPLNVRIFPNLRCDAGITNNTGAITSRVANGASAIAHKLDVDNTYSTAGAKLLSVQNNTVEEFSIDKDGNVVGNAFNGVALTTGGSATNFLNEQGDYVAAGGASALNELTDVTITTLGVDELLFTQDGSTFINQTLAEANIAAADHTHVYGSDGEITYNNGGTMDGAAAWSISASNGSLTGSGAFDTSAAFLATNSSNTVSAHGARLSSTGATSATIGAWISAASSNAAAWGALIQNTSGTGSDIYVAGSTNLLTGRSNSVEQFNITRTGAITAASYNGVALTTGGSATNFLNEQGNYVAAGGASALNELTDVTITTLGTDELLFTQDGSTFINQTLAEANIAAADHTHTDYVEVAGDTMTGNLVIDKITPLIQLKSATIDTSASVSMYDTADNLRGTVYWETTGEVRLERYSTSALQTQLALESNGNVSVNGTAPTADDNLTRKDYVDDLIAEYNWESYTSITYAATKAFDFTAGATQYMVATGNLTTLTTSNRAAGRKMDVIVLANGAARTVTLNASWNSFGEASPITVPSGKYLVMSFSILSSVESSVVVSCVLEN